ncbi:helix-turn-helix transcriptional regulator [Streptomonospora alba]|uniref:helix-turn-helix transcriptional regulator n=1 Tax=Streptomonospora alba TaxID=183763 RepID=UPI00069A4016|nr:helix-turn-helix transcriptional regulator [Streptomonospora alba]
MEHPHSLDSPVGTATGEYVRGRPHPALAGWVAGYSGYREHSAAPLRRRQAPVGGCTLILGFGGPLRLHGPAGPVVPGAFLAGMHDTTVLTEFTGAQEGLQVDLTPLGLFALLGGRPVAQMTNRTPALEEIEAPDIAALPARLAQDAGWAARFARIDAVLLRRLEHSVARPDAEVAWAWGRLVDSAGRVRVEELARGAAWSRRHLLTRFRAQVGLAPKTAARVLRFQRAAALLAPNGPAGGPRVQAAAPPNLADVAAACGYADHSHLVREFRALAGCTPSQYTAEWHDAAVQAGAGSHSFKTDSGTRP